MLAVSGGASAMPFVASGIPRCRIPRPLPVPLHSTAYDSVVAVGFQELSPSPRPQKPTDRPPLLRSAVVEL